MFWYLELSAFNILGSSSHKAALKNSNLNLHCFTQCIFPFSFCTIMSCAGEANFFLNISSYGVHRYPDGFFLSSAFNVCDLSSRLTLHLFHKNSKFPCSSTGVSCGRWQIQKNQGLMDEPVAWTIQLPGVLPGHVLALVLPLANILLFFWIAKSCGEYQNLPAWVLRHWDWGGKKRRWWPWSEPALKFCKKPKVYMKTCWNSGRFLGKTDGVCSSGSHTQEGMSQSTSSLSPWVCRDDIYTNLFFHIKPRLFFVGSSENIDFSGVRLNYFSS